MNHIKVPRWFSKNIINSPRFTTFMDNVKYVDDDKFDLNFLRDIYKTNRSQALDIIDELGLRGFEFYISSSNNLLPEIRFLTKEDVIVSTGEDNKFKKIDFKLLGIGNIIGRFNIRSDSFFNMVPINGFKAITKYPEFNLIKNEFLKAGFLIQSSDLPIVDKIENPTKNLTIEEVFNFNRETELGNFLISDVFAENKFNIVRRYFYLKNKRKLKEINKYDLDEIINIRGMGIKRYSDFKDRLLEFYVNDIELEIIENAEAIQEDFLDATYNIDINKKGLEHLLSSYKVEVVLGEGKFNMIRGYLLSRDITTINEINNEIIKTILHMRGIGKKKYDDFIKVIVDIITKCKNVLDEINNAVISIKEEIYDRYKDMSIKEICEFLNINIEMENIYIRDLQGMKYLSLIDYNQVEKINIVLSELDTKNINEILADITPKMSDKEAIIIKSRYMENCTLEETGIKLDMTRERVRQIQKKALKIINLELLKNRFSINLKLTFKTNRFISIDKLSDLLYQENKYIIEIIMQNDIDGLYYNDLLDLIFLNNKDNDVVEIDKVFAELPDFGPMDDFIDIISSSILNNLSLEINENKIIELLEKHGYRYYGNYLSRRRLSINEILEIIFKYHISGHFRYDEDSYKNLNALANKIFRMEASWNYRSVDGRLRDTRNVILTDSRTFCHIDKLEINISFMHDIKIYIDSYLKDNQFITADTLFKLIEEECITNSIGNKIYLYSLIKYYFGDYYNMGRGNTLTITKINTNYLLTNEEITCKYLIKNEGKALKSEIMNEYSWSKLSLENTISSSDKIISFDSNQAMLMDYIFMDENEIEKFKLLVTGCMKEGFSTSELVKKKMLFDNDISVIINRNGIKESSTIGNIVRKLFPNVTGNTVLLTYRNSKYNSISDVIVEKFPKITSRKEINDYLLEIGYKPSTASIVVRNLILEYKFMELSLYELINSNEFLIDTHVVHALINQINERLGNKDYISLTGIKHYRKNLPDIKFRWNPYIIKSILLTNGFKDVIRRSSDYRNECVIILKESSKINYFDELVYHLLSNEYEGNLHETAVYEYLVSLNLIKEGMKYNRRLPNELYNSDYLTIENTGRIKLNEVQICQISD